MSDQQPDPADLINAWGRITEALGIPWDASAGKVVEEIRKLQKTVADCRGLAVTAAMECGANVDCLIERLADIEAACG